MHRFRPEEALLALYGIALVAIMATTGHWTFTSTMHGRFLEAFLLLALLVLLRGYFRARGIGSTWEALKVAAPPAAMVVRDFLPFLLALLFYETLHDLTPLVRHDVVDAALIAIDRAVLGVDVSVWMGRFATAGLTQVMVFCYLSYFFAPAILAAMIYWAGQRQLFRDFLVSLCVTTLLGYSGYLLVPAVGPYLFQAELFPDRLPGGELHRFESMIRTIDSLKGFARDCFPSLHTAHTTVVLVFAWRFSKVAFAVYLPIAVGLYISTMYLRMHYAVDVLAGFVTAAIAVTMGPRLERWWYRRAPAILAA
ncbi:MAG: phosphatidic acid phosphatase [Myxococcales bacterium]|nr:phosphatidic acid phosphatase [Myxococcales bacterium]